MRLHFAAVLFALLFTACGDEGGAGGRTVKPRGFQGQFRGEGPAGPLTLTLVERGDVVEITLGNDRAVGKRVAADRVEAETKEEGLTGHIVLTLEGDDVRMRSRASSATGESMDLPDVVFRRLGSELKKPDAGGSAGGGARDARLVAHWRSTETRASAELSYAKDTHLVLNADGTFETWDKTVSSFSGTEESAHTRGSWKTEGGQLWIKPDERPEWFAAGKFGLTDTHLMLTDARGEKTIYERL